MVHRLGAWLTAVKIFDYKDNVLLIHGFSFLNLNFNELKFY